MAGGGISCLCEMDYEGRINSRVYLYVFKSVFEVTTGIDERNTRRKIWQTIEKWTLDVNFIRRGRNIDNFLSLSLDGTLLSPPLV